MRNELKALFTELPADHEAREAFEAGDSTPAITHMLKDRPDVNHKMKAVFKEHGHQK